MEKTHEITEKQLLFLKSFLKKYNIPNEDNIELIDHLILEFEHCGNNNLSQYLSNKLSFIRSYTERKRNMLHKKSIQEVVKQFALFFTDLKILPITISVIMILFYLSRTLTSNLLITAFMISMVTPIIYGFRLVYHKNKKIRKNKEFQRIYQFFGLSSIFLYMVPSILHSFLVNHYLVFFVYWNLAFGLSISEIIIAKRKRKAVLEKLNYFKK